MAVEPGEDVYPPPAKHYRRYEDTHHKINWSMIGVLLAFTVNLCTVVWVAANLNSTVRQGQVDTAELKAGITGLSVQAAQNSVRIGVLETKVDDIRDVQRRNPANQ